MTENNKWTAIGLATLIGLASVTGCSMRAKAADFEITTRPTYDGGWRTTYRDVRQPVLGEMGDDGSITLQGPAPANGCDLRGIGGFETVTALHPGERRCNGRR